MEPDKIEGLLQRYWNCETDAAEEAELKRYFQYGPVAEHLLPYRHLFVGLAAAAQQPMPQPFSLEAIQQAAVPANGQAHGHNKAMAANTAAGPTEAADAEAPQAKGVTLWGGLSLRAAAAISAIVIGSVFMVARIDLSPKEEPPYAVNDPQQAYEETKKALMLISARLNTNNASTALHAVSEKLNNNKAGQAIGKVRSRLGVAKNHVYGLGAMGKGQQVIEKELTVTKQ